MLTDFLPERIPDNVEGKGFTLAHQPHHLTGLWRPEVPCTQVVSLELFLLEHDWGQ